PCLRLVRTGIGRINLFDLDLPLGQWQPLTTLP
ncbi:MAG: pseudouridine synthase, partial [Kingella oralis]